MKLLVAFAALVAVAASVPVKPARDVMAEFEAIVAAINSPHTNPATAALLEQQLHEIITAQNPISVGPTIVDLDQSGIIIGPAIVDVDQPSGVIGPAIVTAPQVVPEPSPVVQPETSPTSNPSSSPLVQIILNVNKPSDVGVSPVVAPTAVSDLAPTAVNFVDSADRPMPSPTLVPAPEVIPSPVTVVEEPPSPVHIVNEPPSPVVIVDEAAIIPSPVVTLPEILG